MWALYEGGELNPDTKLTGQFTEDLQAADVDSLVLEIRAAYAEEQERLARIQEA